MTLDKIKPAMGSANTPSVAIHHFTEEEIAERKRKEKEVNHGK